MGVREKLVDIVKRAAYSCLPSNTEDFHLNMFVKDLLAHGVTVQEWISVKDRLPDIELVEAHTDENDLYACLATNALSLINRQKAEIENYSHNNRTMTNSIYEMQKIIESQKAEIERLKPLEENLDKLLYMLNAVDIGQSVLEEQKHIIKAEAIKEFADRLKEKAFTHERPFEANEDKFIKLVAVENIDNLVKEMVGEDK